jgi:hypothetical protein
MTITEAQEEIRQKQIALDAWRNTAARYRTALIELIPMVGESSCRKVIETALAGTTRCEVTGMVKAANALPDTPESVKAKAETARTVMDFFRERGL